MKTTLAGLAVLIGLIFIGLVTRAEEGPPQPLVTNAVTVVMTKSNDDALRVAWKLANNARTNGLAPFTAPTNALSYREFRDEIGRGAFEAVAVQARQQNEAFFIQQFRLVNDDIQARIARILAGKE